MSIPRPIWHLINAMRDYPRAPAPAQIQPRQQLQGAGETPCDRGFG